MTGRPTQQLDATRDRRTGDVFCPPRGFSVDGAMRPLESVQIPAEGVVEQVVQMGDRFYAHLDLHAGPRLMVELGPGPHEVGASYRLAAGEERYERA